MDPCQQKNHNSKILIKIQATQSYKYTLHTVKEIKRKKTSSMRSYSKFTTFIANGIIVVMGDMTATAGNENSGNERIMENKQLEKGRIMEREQISVN